MLKKGYCPICNKAIYKNTDENYTHCENDNHHIDLQETDYCRYIETKIKKLNKIYGYVYPDKRDKDMDIILKEFGYKSVLVPCCPNCNCIYPHFFNSFADAPKNDSLYCLRCRKPIPDVIANSVIVYKKVNNS